MNTDKQTEDWQMYDMRNSRVNKSLKLITQLLLIFTYFLDIRKEYRSYVISEVVEV
jgi:hypothetical protein